MPCFIYDFPTFMYLCDKSKLSFSLLLHEAFINIDLSTSLPEIKFPGDKAWLCSLTQQSLISVCWIP